MPEQNIESQPAQKKSRWVLYLVLFFVISMGFAGYVYYRIYEAYKAMPQQRPLTQAEMPYAGFWQSESGNDKIEIFKDGSVNYISIASSTVTSGHTYTRGGTFRAENGKLTIFLFGYKTELTINQPPQDGAMVLDNVSYKRTERPAGFNWEQVGKDL